MPAGTITLTNNSTAVTGAGTSFITELKPNYFLVAVVGGVTYTLGVDSVTSNTALVLKTAYNGPTTASLAWTPIPNGTLVGITAQVAADVAKAIRGLNLDKANWQQVFSGTGNITVNLPDGSSYTGPAWNSLSSSLAGKANTSELGNSANRNVGKTDGTVAAGNDSRFSTINGMDGGTINGALQTTGIELVATNPLIDFRPGNATDDYVARIIMTDRLSLGITGVMLDSSRSYRSRQGVSGTANLHAWNYYWNDSSQLEVYVNTSRVGIMAFSTSDSRIKEDINYVDESANDLETVLSWKPVTYRLAERGPIKRSDIKRGFIAQDLKETTPLTVIGSVKEGEENLSPEEVVDFLTLDDLAIMSYLKGAIQGVNNKIESQNIVIQELQQRLKALDGLDA